MQSLPSFPVPSPSSSAASGHGQTGRPTKWTPSTERKMARLYLYTTLSVDTIVKVVYSRMPEAPPGLDSAQKKLNSLLDKEPRLLHPRHDSDMGRRVDQLARSLARLVPTLSDDAPPWLPESPGSSWAVPAPGPPPSDMPVAGPDSAAAPLQALSREPHLHSSSHRFPAHGCNPVDDDVFSPFLRRTTWLSTSTDRTTGSFRQLLPGHSEPYVQTVKRLVKRFTAPVAPRCSPSPMPPAPPLAQGCLDNPDGPRPFDDEPFPLPGHLLSCDELAAAPACRALPEAHQHGRCLCFDGGATYPSPWVTPDGMTPAGRCLLASGPTPSNVFEGDSFGNTVLHFLAARGSNEMLVQVLQTNLCDTIINMRNTGGQTFLHVVRPTEPPRPDQLRRLLQVAMRKRFDVCAHDVYGRNVLHVLQSMGLTLTGLTLGMVRRMCPHVEPWRYSKRDAFGTAPGRQPPRADGAEYMRLDPSLPDARSPTALQPDIDPAIAKEATLLENIRLASGNRLLEDADGGNGLHCLAMATLNLDGIMYKYCMEPGTHGAPGAKGKLLDSSSTMLEFRRSLAAGLLEAGVDPNHYDGRGNTPLMVFAAQLPEDNDYRTGPKILDLLIEKGADVHARNRAGETALHVAVRCGRKLAVRTLVNQGANVHARDSEGRGVLDVADAAMASSRGGDPHVYARHEACRAWLSSDRGLAVQRPTVLNEWGRA